MFFIRLPGFSRAICAWLGSPGNVFPFAFRDSPTVYALPGSPGNVFSFAFRGFSHGICIARFICERFFIRLPGFSHGMCIAGFNLQAVFICPPAFPKEVRRLPVTIWRPRRRTAFALDSFWRRGGALLQVVFCPGRFYFEPVFFGWAKVIWIRFPDRIAFVGCRYAFKALPAWCEPEADMVFPGRSHRAVLPAFAAVCCKSGTLFCNF